MPRIVTIGTWPTAGVEASWIISASLGLDPRRFRLSVAAENEPAPGGREVLERGFNSRVEVFLLSEMAEKLRDGSTRPPQDGTGRQRQPAWPAAKSHRQQVILAGDPRRDSAARQTYIS